MRVAGDGRSMRTIAIAAIACAAACASRGDFAKVGSTRAALGAAAYSYDADGLATNAGAPAYALDALGRVVQSGDRAYAYGPDGALAGVTRGDESVTYVVDESGERIAKA